MSVILWCDAGLGGVLALAARGGMDAHEGAEVLHEYAKANAREYRNRYGEEVIPAHRDAIGECAAAILPAMDLAREAEAQQTAYLLAYNAGRLWPEFEAGLCRVLRAVDDGTSPALYEWRRDTGRGLSWPTTAHDGCPACRKQVTP